MRQVKRWRYYCDHCPKAGCSAAAMRQHEQRCVANPNRVCGMCKLGELVQQPMPDLIRALETDGLEGVTKLADGCPACILAACNQSRKALEDAGVSREDAWIDFDYKAACIPFWDNVNEANRFY